MRRGTKLLGLVVAVLALGLGLVWAGSLRARGSAPLPLPPAPPVPSTWSAEALSVPPGERGAETLGGRVLGPDGPVPGALVVALAPPSAEWNSRRAPPERRWDACPQGGEAARLLAWVEAHRREGLPLAHATTDSQGRFLLEGLSPGPVVLWAEKEGLVGLREGASAGPQEQEVRVRAGEQVSGEVRDGLGHRLAGVRVTTLVRAVGRVVETVTDEAGHFALGALPMGDEPLLLSKEGFLVVSEAPRWPRWGGDTMTLFASRRLSGQVLDERGPVVGATVQLETAPVLGGVTTDEQGHFEFEGLCPQRHVLVARQGERIARQFSSVSSVQEPTPARLFLVSAVRLSGRVTDASDRAVADVEVSVSGDGLGSPLQVKTDAGGRFLFEPLVPGRYTVGAQAPHSAPVRLSPRLFEVSQELELQLGSAEGVEGVAVDERGSPVQGVKVQLVDVKGQGPELPLSTSGADGHFVLEAPRSGTWRLRTYHPDFFPEDVTISAPTREARVTLRGGASLEAEVVDEAGRPMEGAEVWVNELVRFARTDARGRAVLHGLIPGSFHVLACAKDRGRAVSQEVTLALQESPTVRLDLPEGGVLSGRVVDEAGAPLVGMRLEWAAREDAAFARCRAPETLSGPDGGFSLTHLKQGVWSLGYSSKEFELDVAASRGVEMSGGSAQVRVSSGESRIQLVFRALKRVRGRVVREDGTPITPFLLNGNWVDEPEGRFSLSLGSVRGQLSFEAPDFAPRFVRVNAPQERGDVELGDVVLHASVTVTGRVEDALSSAPISRALVRFVGGLSSQGPAMTYTQPDGRFTLEGVPAGDGSLELSHPRYTYSQKVAFTQGQEVVARLTPAASLEGRVESDGVPVAAGTVQVRSSRGDIAGTVEVLRGHYLVETLPPGAYMVRVRGPRSEGPTLLFPLRDVELAAGERATLDFTSHITGVSVDVLVPEPGIEVHLIPGELPLLAPKQGLYNKLLAGVMGKRVSDGVRHFSQLPGGSYTLIAIRHDDLGTDVHREQVELPSEGELSFTLAPLWNRFED